MTAVFCIILSETDVPVMQADILDRESQDHNLPPGAWRYGYNIHGINGDIGGNISPRREGKVGDTY